MCNDEIFPTLGTESGEVYNPWFGLLSNPRDQAANSIWKQVETRVQDDPPPFGLPIEEQGRQGGDRS